MIKGIVKLRAKLNARCLSELNILQNIEIPVMNPGPAHQIRARIAKGPYGLELECLGVKPFIDSLRRVLTWIADAVGSLCSSGDIRSITRNGYVDRKPALERGNAAQLPAAQYFSHDVGTVLEERKLVHIVQCHHMGAVKAEQPPGRTLVIDILNVLVGQPFGECIRCFEEKPGVEAADEMSFQSVVERHGRVFRVLQGSVSAVGTD